MSDKDAKREAFRAFANKLGPLPTSLMAAADGDIRFGHCPSREDGVHCEHWWDSEAPCCSCGFDGDALPGGGT